MNAFDQVGRAQLLHDAGVVERGTSVGPDALRRVDPGGALDGATHRHRDALTRHRQGAVGTQVELTIALQRDGAKWLPEHAIDVEGVRLQLELGQGRQGRAAGRALARCLHLDPGKASAVFLLSINVDFVRDVLPLDRELAERGGVHLARAHQKVACKVQRAGQGRTVRVLGAANQAHLAVGACVTLMVGPQRGQQLGAVHPLQHAVAVHFDQASVHLQGGFGNVGRRVGHGGRGQGCGGLPGLQGVGGVTQGHACGLQAVRARALQLQHGAVNGQGAQRRAAGRPAQADIVFQHHTPFGAQLHLLEARLVDQISRHQGRGGTGLRLGQLFRGAGRHTQRALAVQVIRRHLVATVVALTQVFVAEPFTAE